MDVDGTCKFERLLEEIIVNQERAARQYEVGGRSEIKLATLAWNAVKHDLTGISGGLAASIRLAYMEVWRYNIVIDWHLVKDPLPKGTTLEAYMSDMAIRAKIALVMAERNLSAYLTAEDERRER